MNLIIGGMGFIGLNTALRFLEMGESVAITQHTTRRVPDLLAGEVGKRVTIERMDVTNAFQVFDVVRRTKADAIINLMAPPVQGATPETDYHMYTTGLQNVLEAARHFGIRRLSMGSSGAVYQGLAEGPFQEDMPLPIASRTQVGAFKKGMEIHAFHYAERVGIDVISLRIGSIYGPLYASMFNPPSRMCHAAVKGGEPDFADRPNGVIFEDDQADWTYVKDLARGICMVHSADNLSHRIYNIGSGKATSNKEVLAAVQKIVPEAKCSAMLPGQSPNAPRNPGMALSNMVADTGYEPDHSIESGVASYIEWLRSNPQ